MNFFNPRHTVHPSYWLKNYLDVVTWRRKTVAVALAVTNAVVSTVTVAVTVAESVV